MTFLQENYPDTLHCHFERAEHRPPSVCRWLPPARSNDNPDPDSPALPRDPATGLLSLGQKLDYFNKSITNCNTGPEAEIFHLFVTNSATNLTAHPLHDAELRYASPDGKEDFTSSYAWRKLYLRRPHEVQTQMWLHFTQRHPAQVSPGLPWKITIKKSSKSYVDLQWDPISGYFTLVFISPFTTSDS